MPQRTWFITGINSGFGRHMTEQLLARGDRVAGTARKMDGGRWPLTRCPLGACAARAKHSNNGSSEWCARR
jgi:NAD(P)-dependent dehydrogenase (short-subunit alcohol dehydrogenase family)